MKKIVLGLILFAGVGVCGVNAQNQVAAAASAQAASKAVISFASSEHDFGTVPQGTPVTYVFNFRNTGKEPLVLSAVNPSCGCTTPEWPKEPVAPGSNAKITVTYNAANPGTFTKTVTVVSNAATPTTILTIKGEVKPSASSTSVNPAAPAQASAPRKN